MFEKAMFYRHPRLMETREQKKNKIEKVKKCFKHLYGITQRRNMKSQDTNLFYFSYSCIFLRKVRAAKEKRNRKAKRKAIKAKKASKRPSGIYYWQKKTISIMAPI